MHTSEISLIGKNTKVLLQGKDDQGLEVCYMNMSEAETGHMSGRMDGRPHFLYVSQGGIACQVNQKRVELRRGEGLFINCDTFYRFAGGVKGGCEAYFFTVGEALVQQEVLAEKYMKPLMECTEIPYYKLDRGKKESEKILELLENAGNAAKENKLCFEFEVKSAVYQMWAFLFRKLQREQMELKKSSYKEAQKLRKMLIYLHEHYKEKITLTELADNLGISSGDYCRFFKKHMGQTPFEYLQAYRVEKSIPQLLENVMSIAEISLNHGFNGSSYYAETFKKEMGCTPGEYRKWYQSKEDVSCPLKMVQVGNVQQAGKTKNSVKAKNERETMPAHLL